ncbi:MAG: ABC transporter permease subunit [Chloroflexi bacterium]|nr:ABC transporter permease subunit [Chloroflexota bacterium]MDA1002338.1 ABC transporter permease subunit [Chloroflexota bacterium]
MAAATSTPRLRFWHNRRQRRLAIQAAFLAALLLLILYSISRATRLSLGFDFLNGPAGFAISNHWLVEVDAGDPRWRVYLAGVANTVRLVIAGIILATLLGVVMGVARLSGNWLVSRVALVYVEIFRNTPLLVQIVFWYTAVLLKLPRIDAERDFNGVVYLSNRGLALPWPEPEGAILPWLVLCVAAAAAAYYVRRRRILLDERTGRSGAANRWALATFLALAAVAFAVTGLPVIVDSPTLFRPDVGAIEYRGGMVVTPEFMAMLLALVVYTGAFITEIVRGSIQALARGQTEAAMALGMTGYQRMTLIILPQALRTMIPAVTNQFLNLSKNSSLAVVIGYSELFFISGVVINNAGHAVPMFIIIISTYVTLSLLISAAMNWLNRRVQLVGRS